MNNFNMRLVERHTGSKITIHFKKPGGGDMVLVVNPYIIKVYENIIKVTTGEPEFPISWIPLSEILFIEERPDSKKENDSFQKEG